MKLYLIVIHSLPLVSVSISVMGINRRHFDSWSTDNFLLMQLTPMSEDTPHRINVAHPLYLPFISQLQKRADAKKDAYESMCQGLNSIAWQNITADRSDLFEEFERKNPYVVQKYGSIAFSVIASRSRITNQYPQLPHDPFVDKYHILLSAQFRRSEGCPLFG